MDRRVSWHSGQLAAPLCWLPLCLCVLMAFVDHRVCESLRNQGRKACPVSPSRPDVVEGENSRVTVSTAVALADVILYEQLTIFANLATVVGD